MLFFGEPYRKISAEAHLGRRAELVLGSGLLPENVHDSISFTCTHLPAGACLLAAERKKPPGGKLSLPSAGADGNCMQKSPVPSNWAAADVSSGSFLEGKPVLATEQMLRTRLGGGEGSRIMEICFPEDLDSSQSALTFLAL